MDHQTNDRTPYVRFAAIYDRIMRPVGYEMWADYIVELAGLYGRQPRRILDLACGTGSSTLPFARRGYEVLGVDRSAAMLAVARGKVAQAGFPVEFIQADMRSFKVPKPVDLAICLFDSINYLLEPSDIAKTAAAVREALVPDGLFIFDANTRYRLANIEDEVMAFDEEDFCLVWRNSYDSSREVWRVELTGFLRSGAAGGCAAQSGAQDGAGPGDGLFERFRETHEERAYGPEDLNWACEQAGLEVLGMFTAFGLEPAASDSSRVYVVAKRPLDGEGARG